ncbi:hypothetical protein MNBD_CHLOROFLEXI01-4640 [hydrothermal vent metagenome]|uniref:DUF4352 domain-containing protein n=1 Tax=hydrothermal vent metagenome TaxID=652676 RepID=A0A3B0W1F0_9ZZZZ
MKKPIKILGTLFGVLLILVCLGYIMLSLYLQYWSLNVLPSKPNYAGFGDSAPVDIPIVSDEAIPIGSKAQVRDMLVTVNKTGLLTDTKSLKELDEGWIYWYVNISLKNISEETISKFYPISYSRIQGTFLTNQGESYPYIDFGDATTDQTMLEVSEFSPNEVVEGMLIYKVPIDSDLYWIYGESSTDNAVFKVK